MTLRNTRLLALASILTVSLYPVVYGQEISHTSSELQGAERKETDKALWGSWKFGLVGNTFSDAVDTETFAGARFRARGGLKLLEDLHLKSDISLVAANGFSQARFGNDSLNSGINVNEALASYNDGGMIQFDAGIINQSFLNAPLLVSNLPFPGLRQTLRYKTDYFYTGIRAQQAIPTSRSLDSQKRTEKESTPLFFTETAYLEFYPLTDTTLSFSFTNFRFKNLPAAVANNGRLLGNSVPFSTAAQSDFLFDFEGHQFRLCLCHEFSEQTQFSLNASLLENRKAPDAFNRGFLLEGRLTFPIFSQKMGLYIANFFNESDTSPGQYNSSRFGNNNMKGNAFGVSFVINDRFSFGAHYSDADVISANLVNSRRQNFTVGLETVYADF